MGISSHSHHMAFDYSLCRNFSRIWKMSSHLPPNNLLRFFPGTFKSIHILNELLVPERQLFPVNNYAEIIVCINCEFSRRLLGQVDHRFSPGHLAGGVGSVEGGFHGVTDFLVLILSIIARDTIFLLFATNSKQSSKLPDVCEIPYGDTIISHLYSGFCAILYSALLFLLAFWRGVLFNCTM